MSLLTEDQGVKVLEITGFHFEVSNTGCFGPFNKSNLCLKGSFLPIEAYACAVIFLRKLGILLAC